MGSIDNSADCMSREQNNNFIWMALAMLLLITVGFLSYNALATIKEQHKRNLTDNLISVLRTTNNAVDLWIHDRTDDTEHIASRPDTVRLIKELLHLSPTREELIKSPALGELRDILGKLMQEHDDDGFFIISPERISIGSMHNENLGTVNLLESNGKYLDNVFKGKAQVVLPMRSDVPIPGIDGKLVDGEPTMFIAVPVFDEDGSVIAAFTIRLDPFKHFSRVMELARIGESSDIYAFDSTARLLTESRFNDQLRKIGLLGENERSTLSVSLRDPGDSLLYGYKPSLDREAQPLTLMARDALKGMPGINLKGYRDYRGMPVVGTWLWNGEHQFGLAAEMDVSEAYQGYNIIKNVVLFVLSITVLFFVAITSFIIRRNINVSSANERLNHEIRERERAMDELKSVTASKDELAHEMDERRRFENALMESEEKMRSISDAAMDAIIVIDSDVNVIYWNPAAEEIYGYTCEEAMGANMAELIIPERLREGMLRGFASFVNSGEGAFVGKTVEMTAIRKDGNEFRVEHSVSSLKKGGRWCAVGISKDITGRKEAEEALKSESDIRSNLLKISEVTALTTDMDRLLKDVVDTTHEFVGSNFTLSYLWEEETKCFRPASGAGITEDIAPFFMTEPIDGDVEFINSAFQSGRVSILRNLTGEVHKDIETSGLFKWLGPVPGCAVIPLIGRQKWLGLILTFCKGTHHEEIEDCPLEKKKVLLQAVTNNVSTSLEEAKHYKDSVNTAMELSRKVETIQTMSEIGKSILSTHESNVILKTTIKMISRLISCDLVRIVLVDMENNELDFMRGFDEDFMSHDNIVSFDDSNIIDVVMNARPQYIPDLHSLSSRKFIEADLLKRGFVSVLRVPVVIKGNVFAVLGAMSSQRAGFSSEDRDILEKLASQIGIALENARLLTDLEELFIGTVKVLAGTIEAKSSWTRGHSDRVTEFSVEIGRKLGMNEDELKELRLAGLLHDIGKISIHEDILNKTEKLTEMELQVIRMHPSKGADMVLPIKPLQGIIPAIKYHHENYDGTGYPDGIVGDDIPLMARILAVADTADAMGANRPYREGLSMIVIVGELKRCSGTQFDPVVVDAFLETLEINNFPKPAANS